MQYVIKYHDHLVIRVVQKEEFEHSYNNMCAVQCKLLFVVQSVYDTNNEKLKFN